MGDLRRRGAGWTARADSLAVRFSAAPARVLAALLAANVVLGAAGVWVGLTFFDDPAVYFRELAPGTWLSAAHMLAAAAVARAIHRRRHESFWSLCAAVLAGMAVVELTQPTVFLGKWMQTELGLRAPQGIADVDSILVVGMLAALAAVVLPRALVLLEHPRALALLAVGAAVGAASQTLDTLWPVSAWEFVVEDGLKALAEPFVVAGFLVVLAEHRPDSAPAVSARTATGSA